MPDELLHSHLEGADAAVAFAQQVRRYHRRRTGRHSKQRTTDIELALTRLREAMRPLRSAQGKFPFGPQTDLAVANHAKVQDASLAIQRERRKLWKMRTPQTEEV